MMFSLHVDDPEFLDSTPYIPEHLHVLCSLKKGESFLKYYEIVLFFLAILTATFLLTFSENIPFYYTYQI